MNLGTAQIECPECFEVIDVPVLAELVPDEDGRQFFKFTPDMADLWAHAWRHDRGVNLEEPEA